MKTKSPPELPLGALPTEWTQLNARDLENELRVHRYLACSYYDTCLSYASALHWSGWSCHWCPLNPPKKQHGGFGNDKSI